MGREIRRVPANWEHPKEMKYDPFRQKEEEVYKSMYDRTFREAIGEWVKEWQAWERGERPSYCSDDSRSLDYWEWAGGPPDPDYYRPEWPEGSATWYQVYETVSEGAPVTPPFETKEELVEYLVANGDFWDQKRRKEGDSFMRCTPWPRAEAEAFVNGPGWAPSMVLMDGKVMTGTEALV